MQCTSRTLNWSTLGISQALALGMLVLVALIAGGAQPSSTYAQGKIAAPATELHVCPSGCIYSSIQAAVDAAQIGDEIRVAAGVYTGVSARAGVTQVVYLDKTVTIRGGYTTSNWTTPNSAANPTTLDAQRQGRVLYITGNISPTIEGLRITRGNAAGLGGSPLGDMGGGIYVISATATLNNSCEHGRHD